MSGWSEAERLAQWLAQNPHEVLAVARCPEPDGRIVAKVVQVEGLRWAWFAPSRVPASAWASELGELRATAVEDISKAKSANHLSTEVRDGFILNAVDTIANLDALTESSGSVTASPWAFPADEQHSVVVSCPGCRRHYEVAYDNGVLSVSRLRDEDL